MHVVDIVFLFVALIFFGLGLWRGIISEIFRIVGLVGGFGTAMIFHRQLAAKLGFLSGTANVKQTVAFIAIFIVVLLAVLLIGWGVRKAVQFSMMGWADRLIGGLLGLAKAFILAWLIYAAFSFVPSQKFHVSIDKAKIFKFFRSCPVPLPKLGKTPKTLKDAVDPALLKKLEAAGKKLEDLEQKIDSVKSKKE